MAVPGTSVTTVLNCTGLMPPPNPPAPDDSVVPSKVRVPSPPSVMPTFPACEPVAPPAEVPVADPSAVSMKPELPLVVVNSPLPVASATPTTSSAVEVSADPVPVPLPPPPEVPEMIPPENPKFCNILDPLR